MLFRCVSGGWPPPRCLQGPSPKGAPLVRTLPLQQPLTAVEGRPLEGVVIRARSACWSSEISYDPGSWDGRPGLRVGAGSSGWTRVSGQVPGFLGLSTSSFRIFAMGGRRRAVARGCRPRRLGAGGGAPPGEAPGSPGSPWSLGPPEPNSFSVPPCLLMETEGWLRVRVAQA